MVQENEIVSLLLGLGGFVFILVNHAEIRSLTGGVLLIAAFLADLAGSALTVAEGFFLRDLLNAAEHLCYAASAALLALWCYRALWRRRAGP
jgi:hypothetical protein